MTVAEAEHMRRAAEKGRSASFCVPRQLHLTLSLAHSSNDVSGREEVIAQQNFAYMETANDKSLIISPLAKLQPGSIARRSQSCRVQGSRPPRVQRRHETPQGSGSGLDSKTNSENILETPAENGESRNDEPYNPFLKKVGSMGKLLTLAPTDEVDGSPTLRRSASARRPGPPCSPQDSPIPLRGGGRATGTSSVKGRSSTRKGASSTTGSGKKSGMGFLDVRPSGSAETLDPDAYLLRNFSTSTKGIINRGDSFRRRRSRSNSIQPPSEIATAAAPYIPPSVGEISPVSSSPEHCITKESTTAVGGESERYRMVIIGNPGVGKTALLNQFQTSECINAYDCAPGEESNQPISIVLNSIESEIIFINTATAKELQDEVQRQPPPHGWLVVYSITDKASFQKAGEELTKLQSAGLLKGRAVILVGNKCELVRSRAVQTDDARDLACSYGSKFMEISVGMNHKCDELLVGILNQLRLKEEAVALASSKGNEEKSPWIRNRSFVRASIKAKRLVNRIIGKSESKHKMCEDILN